MKKTKKMLSFVLSMLLIVTMFPTMAFAKEEAKTWKFGELSGLRVWFLKKRQSVRHRHFHLLPKKWTGSFRCQRQ